MRGRHEVNPGVRATRDDESRFDQCAGNRLRGCEGGGGFPQRVGRRSLVHPIPSPCGRCSHAPDDRHRSDVPLLRHSGHPDGDRLRLRVRSVDASEGYSFERVTAVLQTRMPTLQPFRRRLMPVPLGLDHPRWVDDPEFDLANHLHRVALPAPGGDAEFRAKVADVMSRPLTAGTAPLGDARRRGNGGRHGRTHRQNPPFRHRRRGRRRAAGQVARSDRRGQRGHRAVLALGPSAAPFADTS